MKIGSINLDLEAKALQGVQGWSIKGCVYTGSDTNGDNLYDITINDPDGTVIGSIRVPKGATIQQIVATGQDADGGNTYDILLDNGVTVAGFTAPKGTGILGFNSADIGTVNRTTVFLSDGTQYDVDIAHGKTAFDLWKEDQGAKDDGTDWTLDEFFEAYRGYSIDSIVADGQDVDGGNVYNVLSTKTTTDEDGNETNDVIGSFTAPKGEKGDKGDDTIEWQWSGTHLGVKKPSDSDYQWADLQGEQGIQGEKGDTGDSIANVQFKSTDGSGSNVYDVILNTGVVAGTITAPKGEKGEQGVQGLQGVQGAQGIQGEKGEKGDTGDVSQAQLTQAINDLKAEIGAGGAGGSVNTGVSEFSCSVCAISDSYAVINANDTLTLDFTNLVAGLAKGQATTFRALIKSDGEYNIEFTGLDKTVISDLYTTCAGEICMVINISKLQDGTVYGVVEDFSKLFEPSDNYILYSDGSCVHYSVVDVANPDYFNTQNNYNWQGKIVFLKNATTLGDYCFSSTQVLTSVSLPNATTLGNNCFSNANALTEIHFASANQTSIEATNWYKNHQYPNACTVYFDL